MKIKTATIEIEIVEMGETWILVWDDGVANTWTESHQTLAIALARASVLVAIDETNNKGASAYFKHEPTQFAFSAYEFFCNQVDV